MKVFTLRALADWVEDQRRHQATKVVHCHGCFDLLHIGHVRHFRRARALGDVLVVTVTSDAHVDKGPGRPVFDAELRAEFIGELSVVDGVAISDRPSAVPAIAALRPDYFVKGAEYAHSADPRFLDEVAAVRRAGGEVAFTDGVVYSSTALLHRSSDPQFHGEADFRTTTEP